MDIPRILADFGREVGESLLDSRIQTVKLSPKDEKKTKLCAFMDLDLDGQCIRFTPTDYMRGISEKRYNYLGNNKAAASQIYIVREVAGFQNFWSGRPRGVMQNLLEFLPEGQLKQTLHSCAHAGFWNDQGLNVSLFQKDGEFLKDLVYRSGEKAFYVGEDKISLERLLSDILEIPAGSKLILIIPRVILNSETLVISQHDEYIRAIASSLGGTNEGAEGVCHICGQNRKDVNTIEYSAKFSRSNVGKIFVTTQVNYASGLRKAAHQQNFGICKSCYEAFMAGEKVVEERFRIRVAKQTALVLFEGVIQPVTMSMVEPFKNHIDAAFNPKDTQEWIDNFRSEVQDSENQNVELFQFHIIFYQTDGKSYKVLKTIEDISRIRFDYVNQVFEEVREKFGETLPNFRIGHLYNMVPVTENKKGEQLDIQRLLDLFAALIKGEMVDVQYIFELACEALEKGIQEIGASTVRNYRNLYRLDYLHRIFQESGWGKDWFIARIVTEYMALIQILQKLQIADKEVFTVEIAEKDQEEYVDSIARSEAYLEAHGLSSQARGLFYLGRMIHHVGTVQLKQKHEKKPILDKISYGGMSRQDVLTLYLEVQEKIRQYSNHVNLVYCERLQKQLHTYIADMEELHGLSEQEMVFFILAGYAFSVNVQKNQDNTEDTNDDEQES